MTSARLDMPNLVERLVTTQDRDGFLDECLDALIEQLGGERALVLENHADAPASVIAARGTGRDLSAVEREEISKSIVRRAVETGECIVWRAPSLGKTASMEALTITAALAAPLRSVAWRSGDDELRGVLYLDFRDYEVQLDDEVVAYFRAAACLVSVVLEMSQRLQLVREDLRVAHARDEGFAPQATLDDLLWAESATRMRRELETCLGDDSSILILGENGTGKTALARAIAEASGRQPIVRAVLGASDDLNTITSELFGHERGAYSGAVTKRVGLVELAKGGTLILDEILNLPRHAQQLLLDFTQFGTYRPLGHQIAEPKRVKVRIIAATNGDLDTAMKEGRFRTDLYYRLAQVVLRIPPLRERAGEVPALAESYLHRIDPVRAWSLSVPLRRALVRARPWPGNVRQLEAVVQRGRQRALLRDPKGTQLELEDVELEDAVASVATTSDDGAQDEGALEVAGRWQSIAAERARLDERERAVLRDALAEAGGVVSRVARELKLPRSTLVSRMNALGVEGAK